MGSSAYGTISDVNQSFLIHGGGEETMWMMKPQPFWEQKSQLRQLLEDVDTELGSQQLSYDQSGPHLIDASC